MNSSHLSLLGLNPVCLTHFPALELYYNLQHKFQTHDQGNLLPQLWLSVMVLWSCCDHKSTCQPEKLASWQNAAASVLISDQIWYFSPQWKNGLSTQLLFGPKHNSTVGCNPCHCWDNWVLCWGKKYSYSSSTCLCGHCTADLHAPPARKCPRCFP